MHPPYIEEKKFAQRLANQGASQRNIAFNLRYKCDMGFYESETIARQAVEFAQEKRNNE